MGGGGGGGGGVGRVGGGGDGTTDVHGVGMKTDLEVGRERVCM